MSVLLFGVSHRSAPVSVLEQLSTDESDQAKIVDQVLQSSLVTEAMVLSTCNRVEVYAVVDAFHGGLSVIGQVLAEHCGMSLNDLTKYAYVRYAEAAVEHLFAVASGLDSAVIGEQQVLGQVRRAYTSAEANHTVGRTLHELSQRALSVGKRVHSETGIDAAGASVVSVALDIAEAKLGSLAGRTAVVIGAGSMGALSAKHLVRAGIERVHVVNRSLPRARRLAQSLLDQGVTADAHTLDDIAHALADADVVITSTGAVRPVVSLADAHRGLTGRPEHRRLVICDLGMPGTWNRRSPGCRVSTSSTWSASSASLRRAPRPPTPTPPAPSWPPRSRTTSPDSGWRRSPHRHRVAAAGRRRGRGGVAAPGQQVAGARRRAPRRGRQDGPPGRRQTPARPDRARQTARQRTRRRQLRRGAA